MPTMTTTRDSQVYTTELVEDVRKLISVWDSFPPDHEDISELAAAIKELREVVADDASTFPAGHPCRDCDQLFKDHPTDQCEGWR